MQRSACYAIEIVHAIHAYTPGYASRLGWMSNGHTECCCKQPNRPLEGRPHCNQTIGLICCTLKFLCLDFWRFLKHQLYIQQGIAYHNIICLNITKHVLISDFGFHEGCASSICTSTRSSGKLTSIHIWQSQLWRCAHETSLACLELWLWKQNNA